MYKLWSVCLQHVHLLEPFPAGQTTSSCFVRAECTSFLLAAQSYGRSPGDHILKVSVVWEGRLGTIPSETVCSHSGSWGTHLPGQRSRKGLSTKNWIKKKSGRAGGRHLCPSLCVCKSSCQAASVKDRPLERGRQRNEWSWHPMTSQII